VRCSLQSVCVIICIFYRWRSILLSRRKSRILFRWPQPSSLSSTPCFISFHLYLKPFLCLNPVPRSYYTHAGFASKHAKILTLCWILQNWHPNKISRLPKSTATIRLGWGRESILSCHQKICWPERCQKHKPCMMAWMPVAICSSRLLWLGSKQIRFNTNTKQKFWVQLYSQMIQLEVGY
jgi:hypothetical protein